MMNLYLPTTIEAGGITMPIRTDFRDVLTVFEMFEDPGLSNEDRAEGIIRIMLEDPEQLYDLDEDAQRDTIRAIMRFIAGGRDPNTRQRKQPRLMSWSQDCDYIIAPVNRVIGYDVRGVEYLHWWTFLSAFREIGECVLSQVINIREKLARGQRLEKWERDWYNKNRAVVDLKTVYTDEEQKFLRELGVE